MFCPTEAYLNQIINCSLTVANIWNVEINFGDGEIMTMDTLDLKNSPDFMKQYQLQKSFNFSSVFNVSAKAQINNLNQSCFSQIKGKNKIEY